MKPEEIRERVNRIMVDEFEAAPEDLVDDVLLADGLGLDSLDGVDLIVALEKEFSLRIEETEARSIRKLGDIYDRVAHRLQSAEGAS